MSTTAPGTLGRIVFLVLGVFEAVIGAWAEIWPARFYASFPGGGWHWVQASGAYDEHLLRDFGGLSLALAVVTLAAARRASPATAVTACVAWEIYSVPHLAYHASHLDALPTAQDVASIASLALTVVAPLVAAALVWRGSPAPVSGRPERGGHQAADPVGVGDHVDLDDPVPGHGEGHHH